MASVAELQDALVNADRAGDTAAARQLADAIVSAQQVQSAKPAAVQAGESLSGIPRQMGLTARYGLEGLGQMAQIGTEPIRQLITDPAMRAVTGKTGASESTGDMASRFADFLGLPKPQGANERVIADASRLVAGAGGMGVAGRAASAAPGLLGQIGAFFGAAPAQQALGAAGAGLGGGSAREAGAGPGAQALASLVGGVATPMIANGIVGAAKTGATALKTAMTPQKVIDQQVDQQITLTLRNAGIDWTGVSERVKQGMRADVQSAVLNGQQLDPVSMARMLQFRLVPGSQPTRGMLSQDPVQITREQNLAKVGANSTDLGLQKLPNLQSGNTAALINTLDDAGARGAPDAFAAGQQTIDALSQVVRGNQRNINQLYQGARDTNGRSAPLDGHSFTMNANRALDEANVGSFLTPDIAKKMNAIAMGEIPLTVDVAEQLKTSIGNIQRGSADGNVRKALGIVRGALDDAPLQNAPHVNPGNLPAVPGTVPPSPAVLGEDSIAAFNAARSANRSWMQRLESTPALKAVADGIEPDKFVTKFITGQGATVADVHSLREAVSQNPQALTAIKQNIVAHLKSEAVPKDGINIFNASGYNNALDRIGERKLAAFFSAEEIATLKAVGNVSNLMSAQPAGTAVNNSNSGAYVAAKAMDLLDAVSGKVPLGVGPVIQGTIRGVQQRQVMNAPQSLTQKPPPVGLLQRLGPPAIYGGLLAAQPSQ